FRISNVELSPRGEDLTVSGIARRHYAIEHIHAARHRLDQVFRRSHSHQVSGLVGGNLCRNKLCNVIHLLLLFADAEPPDGVALKPDLDQVIEAFGSQVFEDASLIDAEKGWGNPPGPRRVSQPIEFGA